MNLEIGNALVIEENDLGYVGTVELTSSDTELTCIRYIHVLVGDVAVAEMLMLLLL